MIKELPESEGSVLGIEITGKVSLEEEKKWIARFDDALEKHERISALFVLGEEARWGVEAGFEDVKWIMTHLSRIHRIAFVSDSKTWEWLIAIDSPFAKMFGIGEKHFGSSEIDAAWAWIKG
jgi:hypothetical protein